MTEGWVGSGARPGPWREVSFAARNSGALTLVLLAHVAALWAIGHGLVPTEQVPVTAAEILVELLDEPPPPPPEPPRPMQRLTPRPLPTPTPRPSAPQPAATAPVDPQPAPLPLPAAPHRPDTAGRPSTTTPVATVAASAPVAIPSPPPLSPPSASAEELNNPKPAYPPLSRRLGEQGQVVVRVFVSIDGTAQKADIKTTSGYERLDQAALNAVQRWRYVPARRAGVPEAMWFNVPVNFVLE